MAKHINVPTEILRSVDAIARTGSFSKAAEELGLSQPAISAQMKRAQSLAGGALFQKTLTGMAMTERGKLVVAQAQRIIEANDQILRLGNASQTNPSLRLGLTQLYAGRFLEKLEGENLSNVVLYVDFSKRLAEGISNGYLDIACVPLEGARPTDVLAEFEENMVWVRARTFSLAPGSPIPIVSAPESIYGEIMIRALNREMLSYRIAVSCVDFATKMSAVHAGIGISASPERLVPPSLLVDNEYDLPSLEPLRVVLCARSGFDVKRYASLMSIIVGLFPNERVVAPLKRAAS